MVVFVAKAARVLPYALNATKQLRHQRIIGRAQRIKQRQPESIF
jgi:hypothetical protein